MERLQSDGKLPEQMQAAVYRGEGRVLLEQVPRPKIGPGEVLVRVAVCGVCNTDIKKITADLLPPPRIFGHETAGTVVAAGTGVDHLRVGDRVVVFHHIPCGDCFYCRRRLYAQCPTYRKVGVTAGFEPSDGGFAQYVRVMDWIATQGTEKIPDGVSFEEASFVEPINTCLKALKTAGLSEGECVLIQGQGPIGVLLLLLARRQGAEVFVSDPLDERLKRASELGAAAIFNPRRLEVSAAVLPLTGGRGVDLAIVAAPAPDLVSEALRAVRPGGRVLLFAQTAPAGQVPVPTAAICVEEKQILGSYSTDWDLQAESARLVFERELSVQELITHRFSLSEIDSAIRLAADPQPDSLKIVVKCV